MQRKDKWRLAASAAMPVVLVVTASIMACHEEPTAARSEPGEARITLAPSAAAARERERLSARNPQDWVGKAHNKALDDFRKELRRPGAMTKEFCARLKDYVVHQDRIPRDRPRADLATRGSAAEAARSKAPICQPRTPVVIATTARQELSMSPTAYSLFSNVQTAVSQSQDRWELASRLNSVLDGAASLEPVENELISAVVSVAQSSWEYWETELASFQAELWNTVAPCALDAQRQGYSVDQARQMCMESGGSTIASPLGAPTLQFRYTSVSRGECRLTDHLKRLAGADAVGAFVGGVKGGVTLGFAGILPGAFAGAAYGSLASFVYSTWELYWCAMPAAT